MREYGLRVGDAALLAAVTAAVYLRFAQWPVAPADMAGAPEWMLRIWAVPPFAALCALPAAVLGFFWFPSRFRLGRPPQLGWSKRNARPYCRSGEANLVPVSERPYWGAVAMALLLGAVSGALSNLALWLPMLPFLVFRLFSRLYTELDLSRGQVFYHRTFLGLTLTRSGPDFQILTAVLSGYRSPDGEDRPRYSVALLAPGWTVIPVHPGCETLEAAHRAGYALAAQLDVPFCRLNGESLEGYACLGDLGRHGQPQRLWSDIVRPKSFPSHRGSLPE